MFEEEKKKKNTMLRRQLSRGNDGVLCLVWCGQAVEALQ